MSDLLMLPDHPDFQQILALNPPPDVRGFNEFGCQMVIFGADGMPRTPKDAREIEDYFLGGEYETRLTPDDPYWGEDAFFDPEDELFEEFVFDPCL